MRRVAIDGPTGVGSISQRHAERSEHRFLGRGRIAESSDRGPMPQMCGRPLQGRGCPAAPGTEQWMVTGSESSPLRQLRKHSKAWRENELCIPARTWPTNAERFTPGHEQDLVRIGDHVIAADVPGKHALIRESDLKLGRQILSARLPARDRPDDVFNSSAGRGQQLRASHCQDYSSEERQPQRTIVTAHALPGRLQ
jgi:hypothetical protein